MATTSESDPPLSPTTPPTHFRVTIKGTGQISPSHSEDQGSSLLSGTRIQHGLITTCLRMELSSLRPWTGTREDLLHLVASAVRCLDATLARDEPASPVEPNLQGWIANFQIWASDPRITPELLRSLLGWGGLINGLEDWQPAYGRFAVVNLEESEPPTC